jgi:CPA1 family monovalent cation:H+ antiporter
VVPVFAAPGEVLIRKGDRGDAVYFIASGAVEIDLPGGHSARLGRGDMFGEMAVLSRRPRQAQVKAIGYSTLMCLDEGRFLALLDTNPVLKAHVDKTIEARKAPAVTARRKAEIPA